MLELLGPDTGGTIVGASLQSALCCIIGPMGCIGCGAGGGGGGGCGCGSAGGGAVILCTGCIILGPET